MNGYNNCQWTELRTSGLVAHDESIELSRGRQSDGDGDETFRDSTGIA